MRALRYHRYGSPDVLQIDELPEPSPGADEAKVLVRAVALNPIDWKIRAGHVRYVPLFRSPPRGVGVDFAGEIASVGGGATRRRVGERVLGSLSPFGREGSCTDYVVVPYDRLSPIPEGIDDFQAATLPIAGGTALQALDDDAQADELEEAGRVLITGAAGGVGHFAVQIAKYFGLHVVAVCSARNADFARLLGADEVIDYAKEDFTLREDRFDVVFDAACASSFEQSRRVLTTSGCYINTSGDAASLVGTIGAAVFARLTSRQRAIPFALRNAPGVWNRLLDFVKRGVLRPHIERTIPIEDVAAAFRAMETGHGRGKIVVRLD
jgi:NADPH:quinone reductase-like Zn-dependent oxidoreductase